jgi:23S rRNA pseudouridine2605 synthase
MSDDSLSSMRLNKSLALALGVSRREADNIIAANRATINNQPATLGARYHVGDEIKVDGKQIKTNVSYQYLALNKPEGYVCSRKQQGDSPTIYDLLPLQYHQLKTVGRLDRNSSGLILLSNDGDFTYRMTHPSFVKVKVYKVRLDGDLAPLHQQMISDHGVQLEDGASKLQLERMNETDRKNWIVTMHEGRNRQIRRTFDSLGYTVVKLHRTNFANFAIGDLKPGEYQVINKI